MFHVKQFTPFVEFTYNIVKGVKFSKGENVSRETFNFCMELFFQLLIIGLAVTGLCVMVAEICKIYGKGEKLGGRIYILCVPQTENLEGFCTEVLNRFRRNGFGEDILICSENMTEEEKNIGRLFESTDKGIYFIEPDDLHKVVR